jgi:hypothetical protein
MPHIIYGGVKFNQIKHALYCKKCKDIIESLFQHDLKFCSCRASAIDGGILDGNIYIGDKEDIEPRSMYVAIVDKKEIWLPKYIIERHFYENN